MHGVNTAKIKTMMEVPSSDTSDQCCEITLNDTLADSPPDWTSKVMRHDLFGDTIIPDLDMKVFDDFGTTLTDTLGDSSMDSFTDLTTLMPVNSLLESHSQEDTATSSHLLSLNTKVRTASKRTFDEVEDSASDLCRLQASVGLARTTSKDHEYSSKRQKLSPEDADCQVDVDDLFTPSPSSAPSPSPSTSALPDIEDRRRIRREKNNMASRRSREIRKQKFEGLEKEAERLCQQNEWLEQQVQAMENMAQRMKDILVARMGIKS